MAVAQQVDVPETPLEERMEGVSASLFKLEHVGVEQNFFLDLGGHSLLAAKLVAALHNEGIEISVREIYSHPTIRQLANHVGEAGAQENTDKADSAAQGAFANLPNEKRKPGARLIAAQVLYYLTIVPILSLPLLLVIPWTVDMLYFRRSVVEVIVYVLALALCLWPIMLIIGIGSKSLIIGRYKPGAYPLWGSYYFRWWLASRLQRLSGTELFNGTPLAPLVWRLMGAKVGAELRASLPHRLGLGLHIDWRRLQRWRGQSNLRSSHRAWSPSDWDSSTRQSLLCRQPLCYRPFNAKMGDDALLDDQSFLPDDADIPAGKGYRVLPRLRQRLGQPKVRL